LLTFISPDDSWTRAAMPDHASCSPVRAGEPCAVNRRNRVFAVHAEKLRPRSRLDQFRIPGTSEFTVENV
jgi:hypothetical protein